MENNNTNIIIDDERNRRQKVMSFFEELLLTLKHYLEVAKNGCKKFGIKKFIITVLLLIVTFVLTRITVEKVQEYRAGKHVHDEEGDIVDAEYTDEATENGNKANDTQGNEEAPPENEEHYTEQDKKKINKLKKKLLKKSKTYGKNLKNNDNSPNTPKTLDQLSEMVFSDKSKVICEMLLDEDTLYRAGEDFPAGYYVVMACRGEFGHVRVERRGDRTLRYEVGTNENPLKKFHLEYGDYIKLHGMNGVLLHEF